MLEQNDFSPKADMDKLFRSLKEQSFREAPHLYPVGPFTHERLKEAGFDGSLRTAHLFERAARNHAQQKGIGLEEAEAVYVSTLEKMTADETYRRQMMHIFDNGLTPTPAAT